MCSRYAPSSKSAPLLCRLLAMCTHVAANLPYKRGDEVCYVLHTVNSLISRRGDAVQTALKLALDDAAAGHPRQQVSFCPAWLSGIYEGAGAGPVKQQVSLLPIRKTNGAPIRSSCALGRATAGTQSSCQSAV